MLLLGKKEMETVVQSETMENYSLRSKSSKGLCIKGKVFWKSKEELYES